MTQLITLSDEQRRDANRQYLDPDAWQFVESHSNNLARSEIRQLARTIELARQHPDDPDCRRLLDLLRQP